MRPQKSSIQIDSSGMFVSSVLVVDSVRAFDCYVHWCEKLLCYVGAAVNGTRYAVLRCLASLLGRVYCLRFSAGTLGKS
jgi:hypothetical protein